MDGATKRYIDKDNDKVSYTEITEANKDKIKQSSVANVGGIIDGVYNAINYVELSIKNDTRTLINVKAYKDGGSLCIEKLNIDMIKDSVLPVVSVGVLEGLQGHTYDLAALLNVLGLGEMGEKEHEVANPNPTTSGSASGTPTNSIDDTLKGIKPYIDGLGIKIDSNGLDVGYSASFGNASKGEVVTDLTASLTINSTGFAANVIAKNSATEEHYKLDLAATIKNINFKYGTAVVPTPAA